MKFGLIGHPIAHSLSPALFKAAYGGEHTYELIEGDDFESSYNKFLEEYDAINVTAPFKEAAARRAAECTKDCEAIGAANILIKHHKPGEGVRVAAANSDTLGVLAAARSGLYPDKKINPVALVVGCGGAGKAAAYAVASASHKTFIINRNFDKARDYATRLSTRYGLNVTAIPMDDFRSCFREAGMIIYTLPVAIPQIKELSGNDLRGNTFWRRENKVLLEANYKDPAFTPELLKKMRKANSKLVYVSGKEWLLWQAEGAFSTFTGRDPNIDEMRKVL